jgi:uncharacterized protein YukE
MGNNTTGTAAPQVSSGPSYSGYTAPANWGNPAVSGHDLIVHRDVLRSVASQLDGLAGSLQGTISGWSVQAAQGTGSAFGNWWAANILAHVAGNAHAGVGTFSDQLRQAHSDTATRLVMSADKYDAAEQHITALISASTDPSATIVEGGGNNVAVDPGYGLPAAQAAAAAHAVAMERRLGGNSEDWTGTLPVTQGTSFAADACYYYTWQEVQALLAATNPDAITAAGQAYLNLSHQLTTVTGQLAQHGATLAQNWGGPTALTAVSQVQQLHQTATDMQAQTYQAGVALSWYGPVLAAFAATVPQPTSTHSAATNAANQAANQHMDALNGHMQTAYNNMPVAVNKNLPPPLAGSGGSGTAGGVGGSGAGGGGSMPSVTGGGAGSGGAGTVPGVGGITPTVPSGPTVGPIPTGPTAPTGPSGPPTTVVGYQPPPISNPGGPTPIPPGGPTPPPITTPPGGNPGGPGWFPPIPPGSGPGKGSPGGVTGEEPIPGEPEPGFPGFPGGGGLPPGIGTIGEPGPIGEVSGFGEVPTIGPAGMITGGQGGLPGEDLSASGDAAMGEGMGSGGGFPMMGMGGMSGGAQGDGIGRDRTSWTTEDEGTWGPDGAASGGAGDAMAEDGMPGGGMMPFSGASGQGQDRDRSRQAWMSEEEDLWGGGQQAVPPVINQN